MAAWRQALAVDPVPPLLATDDESLAYFVRRDLLDEAVGPIEALWTLPRAEKLLKKQQADGSWRYPGQGRQRFPETNYDLLQTFKALGTLLEKHGLEKGLDWLLAMRQDDGGWIVPLQAVPAKDKVRELWTAAPIPPERHRPHAHLATGMALRPLVAHPGYRHRAEVHWAAERLKEQFFKSDRHNDRRAPAYWTNLLTTLDSLSLLGYPVDDEAVQRGLGWFVDNQQADGLWHTAYEQKKRKEPSAKEWETMQWLSLAICRVLKRYEGRISWTGN